MSQHNRVRPTETTLTIFEMVDSARRSLDDIELATDSVASAKASLTVARISLGRLAESIEDAYLALDETFVTNSNPGIRRALADMIKINETIGKATEGKAGQRRVARR